MRDPYLYDDVNVLKNFAGIKDNELLKRAEADITNLAMIAVYNQLFDDFSSETLCEIHRLIFGQIYDWAGEFRNIHIIKREDILGGDTVRYAYPQEISSQLKTTIKELSKLKRVGNNDKDIIFRLVRITSAIWQIHPFREGNTRTVIVFAVLFAKHLGFDVKHELFKTNASYVRNSLVWASQGIYSKYEYLEAIFFDAMLDDINDELQNTSKTNAKYEKIGDYNVHDYHERPHESDIS